MFKIDLPLIVRLSGSKSFSLNLNQYRNAHYYTLNNAKLAFAEHVSPLLSGIPKLDRVKIEYTVYPKTRRLLDISNVCSVTDKFFCDVLVDQGILEDDNYSFLPAVSFSFGSIDKTNPRTQALILPL